MSTSATSNVEKVKLLADELTLQLCRSVVFRNYIASQIECPDELNEEKPAAARSPKPSKSLSGPAGRSRSEARKKELLDCVDNLETGVQALVSGFKAMADGFIPTTMESVDQLRYSLGGSTSSPADGRMLYSVGRQMAKISGQLGRLPWASCSVERKYVMLGELCSLVRAVVRMTRLLGIRVFDYVASSGPNSDASVQGPYSSVQALLLLSTNLGGWLFTLAEILSGLGFTEGDRLAELSGQFHSNVVLILKERHELSLATSKRAMVVSMSELEKRPPWRSSTQPDSPSLGARYARRNAKGPFASPSRVASGSKTLPKQTARVTPCRNALSVPASKRQVVHSDSPANERRRSGPFTAPDRSDSRRCKRHQSTSPSPLAQAQQVGRNGAAVNNAADANAARRNLFHDKYATLPAGTVQRIRRNATSARQKVDTHSFNVPDNVSRELSSELVDEVTDRLLRECSQVVNLILAEQRRSTDVNGNGAESPAEARRQLKMVVDRLLV